MGRPPVTLFAVAGGIAVASNYYVQALLPAISADFGLRTEDAGLLVTVSQLGYLAGVVLIVPLGDLLDRRRLVLGLTAASVIGLSLAAVANGALWLIVAVGAFGTTTVLAQVLVSLVADLSEAGDRGTNVGRVMTGILLGVLLARTAAGAIAELGGWRAVYWSGATLMAGTGVVLWRRLPLDTVNRHTGYRSLMASIVGLLRREPVLQVRAAYGALTFAAFSVLWSTLALMLARPPYSYSEGAIGLFGLAAAMGAGAALLGGRLFDRGYAATITVVGLLAGLAGFALLEAGSRTVSALIAGVLLVDFGGQLVQVASQGCLYELRDGIRGRLTTAYMGTRFAGGVLGSALGVSVFAYGGWLASSALGCALYAAALLVWFFRRRLDGPTRPRRLASG